MSIIVVSTLLCICFTAVVGHPCTRQNNLGDCVQFCDCVWCQDTNTSGYCFEAEVSDNITAICDGDAYWGIPGQCTDSHSHILLDVTATIVIVAMVVGILAVHAYTGCKRARAAPEDVDLDYERL